ncbi:MAG TPA: hypothetical protein VHE13_03085 [Opitutus sp.]|nr:hypothetical protein [Opitutus sp.]
MDDELHELEAELLALRPARVPRALLRRIALDLGDAGGGATASVGERDLQVRASPVAWLPWLTLPIAAAIALAIALPHRTTNSTAADPVVVTPPAAAPAPAFKPVAAQNVLVSARDEGYVTLADGTRARRVRQSYVDTITWKNPRTKASLTWSVPCEEVSVTPVSYE